MPIQDSKVSELSKLKSKLIELENQIKEEKKITMKLREKSESKIQQIMITDSLITEEIERFKWKKENILNEHKFLIEKSNNKLNNIYKTESDIKFDIAEFDLLSYNNDIYHNMIKELSAEQFKNTIKYQKEIEKKSQKNFDIRIDMEEIQRKTIKSFNDNYQRDAVTKMELEAAQAKTENDRIHHEFDIRESKTNTLIKQQQHSYDQLMKMKIERDVLRVSVDYQDKLIKGLSNENNLLSKELNDLQYNFENTKKEINLLQHDIDEKLELLNILNKLKEELLPIQQESKILCKSVIKLCQKIILSSLEISQNGREFQSSQISKSIESIEINDDNNDNDSKNNSPVVYLKDFELNDNENLKYDDLNNTSISNENNNNEFQHSNNNSIKTIKYEKNKRNKDNNQNIDNIKVNFSEINPNLIWSSNIQSNQLSTVTNKHIDMTYKPMNNSQKLLIQKKINESINNTNNIQSYNNEQNIIKNVKPLNTSFSMFMK